MIRNRWLTREHYGTYYRFIGPKVVALFALGSVIGSGLFFIELAFAYGLQAFLVRIGALSELTAKLPEWWSVQSLESVLLFIVLIGVIRGGMHWAQIYTTGAAEQVHSTLQRSRLLTWAFQSDSASSIEATTLFGEVTNRACAVVTNLQGIAILASTSLLLCVSLLYMSPQLTLIIGLALCFVLLPLRWTDRRLKSAGLGMGVEWQRINARLLLSIRNLLLMQIYGTQKIEEAYAQSALRNYLSHILSFHLLSGFKFAFVQVSGVLLICIITLASYKIAPLTPGALIAYFYLLMRFIQTLASLSVSFTGVLTNYEQLRILEKWWTDKAHDGIHARRISQGELPSSATPFSMPVGWRLTGVGYRYPDGPSDLFSMLDLEVAPGQTLVVFGPSGVGKSTLLNLFLGGIQPTQGHIDLLLDNGVIKPLSSFRSRILASVGYVGTDSFIFEGTVFENLTYGLLMPPAQSEVSRALELAECGFVKSLDKGLDYKLTEQGQGLSAGQKQRLSLARALLRNPKILILDEATANLDADIEAKLLTTLLRLKGQMTILAVTHRPSVMMIADLQLDLGRVEYRSN